MHLISVEPQTVTIALTPHDCLLLAEGCAAASDGNMNTIPRDRRRGPPPRFAAFPLQQPR